MYEQYKSPAVFFPETIYNEVNMPMYEYRCTKCGSVSEFLVYGGNADGLACPSCGNAGLEKMISAPNVHTTPVGSTCQSMGCPSGPQCGSSPCASGGCCPKAF